MTRSINVLVGTALVLAGGTAALAAASRPTVTPPISATLATANGAPAGTATITMPARGNPVLRVTVSGLPAGVHGIHLHTTGKCEAPAFASAGGHLNPTGHQHGKDNPAGSHLGDLPNITVDARGNGKLVRTMAVDASALRAQLLDADGTALVIHAKPDDYRTDPSGNSGDRIACGVLG